MLLLPQVDYTHKDNLQLALTCPKPDANDLPSHTALSPYTATGLNVLVNANLSSSASLGSSGEVALPPHEEKPSAKRIKNACDSMGRTAILLVTTLTIIMSAGTPYWCYRCHRRSGQVQHPSLTERGVGCLPEEQWQWITNRLKLQWKGYYVLSAGTLPMIFPMLAIYPVPKCSWTFLFATIALLSGLASLVVNMLYQNLFDELQQTITVEHWLDASRNSWMRSSTQRFWLFISLPTIWLFNSICALTLAIVFAVWEQVSITAGTMDVCLPWRLQIFKGVTILLICIILVHLAFLLFVAVPIRKSLAPHGEIAKSVVHFDSTSQQ